MASIDRRDFMARGSMALAGSAVPGRRLRLAQVGTGGRGMDWARYILANFGDIVEMVGFCDINPKRVEVAREMLGSAAPGFVDFERMVEEAKPEMVLITTPDSSHSEYIVRAMQLGRDVLTEKPLCTDEQQCRTVLAAEKRYGRKLMVAFNARHFAEAKKVKELLQQKAIGEVLSIDYQEYLDTSHGASYFRRWHRIKEMSGTLLVSKSCHHFDQVNWWLDSVPVEVVAYGDLRFYGKNNPFRHTHCRGCPYQKRCAFYQDITANASAMKLYVGCESEDGYLIDGCVWRQDVNIYDTWSVMVRYANGARLTYTANTFLPYEGQEIVINGTRGRIDYNNYDYPGGRDRQLRLTRTFSRQPETINPEERAGGHGGADPSVRELIFRGEGAADPLQLRAGSLAGAYSSLVGIAGYRSIERGGERIRISDLASL